MTPRGTGAGGKGMGRNSTGGGRGLGPNGNCVCPNCGEKIPHERGIPCFEVKCPKCNSSMTRE